MKKFLSFIFALLVLVPCTYFLTACGEDKGKEKVMNISLNPSLEFVLDKNDKVVTVNALNEDGNYLLSLKVDEETAIEAFKDMTAEEAAELFLTLTRDNGFLVSGDDETLTISISGSEKDLLNSVKNTANKYLQEKGVDLSKLTLKVEELEKSELVTKVQECMQEYAEKDLKDMSEEELVALIKESRKETEDLLTQDLKEAYYALRNSALENAEFQAVLGKINSMTEGLLPTVSEMFGNFQGYMTTFEAKMNDMYAKYLELLNSKEYQDKVQAYVSAKKAIIEEGKKLLDENLTDKQKQEILDGIANMKQGVKIAYGAIDTARDTIDGAINTAKDALDIALKAVQGVLDTVKTFIPNIENDINTALATAKEDFKTEFKTKYAEHLESYWTTTSAE